MTAVAADSDLKDQDYWPLLERALNTEWSGDGRTLNVMCRYTLQPLGKLLRPALLLDAGVSVGGRAEDLLPAAVAIELGHVASLAHDDIVDGDQVRRNRPATHVEFGVGNAITVGDALSFRMFEGVAQTVDLGVSAKRVVSAMRLIARMGVDICHGQIMEDQQTQQSAFDLDAYFDVVRCKTAAFFRGSCECGAVLGGGTPRQISALGRYGHHLGLAFQIRDDLLPYVSDPSTTGKSAASDVRNRRLTIPVILAHRSGSPEGRRQLENLFGVGVDGAATADAFRHVHAIVEETDAVEQAMRMTQDEVFLARTALMESIPNSPSRIRMDQLLTFVTTRSM